MGVNVHTRGRRHDQMGQVRNRTGIEYLVRDGVSVLEDRVAHVNKGLIRDPLPFVHEPPAILINRDSQGIRSTRHQVRQL